MKRRIGFLAGMFLLISQPVYSMGWGDWAYTTKNGTTFIGAGGVGLKSGRTSLHVKKWYYYKDHIIGHYYPYKYDDTHKGPYFILNEISKEFSSYSSKEEWRYSINRKGLKPKIKARWFSDHSTRLLVIPVILIGYPLVSILFYFLIYLFLEDIFLTKIFNIKIPFNQFFSGVLLLTILRIYLCYNLQSF